MNLNFGCAPDFIFNDEFYAQKELIDLAVLACSKIVHSLVEEKKESFFSIIPWNAFARHKNS